MKVDRSIPHCGLEFFDAFATRRLLPTRWPACPESLTPGQ